jgi:beta-galactosidase
MKNSTISILISLSLCSFLFSQTRIKIPDGGWNLWLDTSAQWMSDSIFLPDEVNLDALPVNIPTGGWKSLNEHNAIQVTLPATVEQYFWGVKGYRPYRNGEYAYEQEDPTVFNGNYLGVSWWWRDVDVPKSFAGKHVLLHIRGARLRAEVFVNEKLVGYNIITEIPFECDISRAILPGKKNRIAIRITNPGGRLDWVDTELMTWGTTQQRFHKSHGFGGLDRGMEISAHDSLMMSDAWVLNTSNVKTIRAYTIVKNLSSKTLQAVVRCEISADRTKKVEVSGARTIVLKPGVVDTIMMQLENNNAQLWSNDTPHLYQLKITTSSAQPKYADARAVRFGYRWFDAVGIGSNAMLRFNGKRIRLTSAISWGFWGLNGLFPTRELAEREVTAAKTLGLNCIQFHRNVGKKEVLDAQDRLGLMRYMEPGGGQTAFGEKFSLYASSPTAPVDISGKNGDAQTFAERYMEEKIIRMVRAHRSHPSLLMYAIQNEIHPDLQNPRIFCVLRRIHAEDPSRIVVLKSGFPSGSPSTNQVWMKPYSNDVLYDTGNAYSGWWDDHTVGGPGVWRDELYKNPTDFTHRSTNDKEIVMWGEMLGAAVPDNHKRMVAEIKRLGGNSYDLKEHQEILTAYESFIDRWGFRKAFPDIDALFVSIGYKSYDFWGRVIETARLAEANDYFVISGWESTAIENHSGLVDNLRMFKGDPSLLKNRLTPLHIAIKTSSTVYAIGDSLFVDLYLLNETHQPHPNFLSLYITYPSFYSKFVGTFVVPKFETDRFVYPVAERFSLGKVDMEGEYTITARLQMTEDVWTNEKVLVVNPVPASSSLKKRIGVISALPELQKPKELLPGIIAVPYKAGEKYDLLLAANRFTRPAATRTEVTTEIEKTDDDEIYRTINFGDANSMEFLIPNLPKDSAIVTLKFAELFQNAVNMRIFDVALNGTIVLKDFDVYKFAGGKNIAFDTTFKILLGDGALHITFPRVPKPSARICGIKIEMKDTVVAINCGGSEYRDAQGILWKPYGPPQHLSAAILDDVKRGTPLIVLSEGQAATEAFGKELSDAGAFQYKGCLSEAFASWMGSWYFVRSHPVYDGLPVNCAMGSYYQVPVTNGTGLLIDGDNIEIFAAYSRDHSHQIAAASFTATLGKGSIIVHTIPGMVSNLIGESAGIHPVVFQRLLSNSLQYAFMSR